MSLSSSDATRVLRFCLTADDAGTVEEREDGARVVTIVTARPSYQVHTFEEATFEAALRSAAAAGILRPACVDKQITFTARHDADTDGSALGRLVGRSSGTPPEGRPATGDPGPFLSVADAIGALLHQTQRERGMSALFVGSAGKRLGDELGDQWSRTDEKRALLVDLIGQQASALPGAVQRRLQQASTLLEAVGGTRDSVVGGRLTVARVIDAYSALNAALLGVVEAFMVSGGVVGPPRNDALSCVVLQHAKEKAGIERAQLAVAFLQDRFLEGQRLAVVSLIAAQSTYLHIFSATAPQVAETALRRALTSPEAADVQRMEAVVFGDGETGFGIDPGIWFQAISRKIDMMGDVSQAVIGSLRSRQ